MTDVVLIGPAFEKPLRNIPCSEYSTFANLGNGIRLSGKRTEIAGKTSRLNPAISPCRIAILRWNWSLPQRLFLSWWLFAVEGFSTSQFQSMGNFKPFRKASAMTSSIIEEDLIVEGDIKSDQGSVEVKGKVIGDVAAKSVLVQAAGTLKGAVTAETVTVEGNLTGSIKCDDLNLHSSSNVQADIAAKSIATQTGAKIVGKVQVSGK